MLWLTPISSHKYVDGLPQKHLTKGRIWSPPSIRRRPSNIALREIRSSPSIGSTVASGSVSVKVCKTWATHSHPALDFRAYWKGAVAVSTLAICFVIVRTTSLRILSPTTIPLTPPSGFWSAVNLPSLTAWHPSPCEQIGHFCEEHRKRWSDVMPDAPRRALLGDAFCGLLVCRPTLHMWRFREATPTTTLVGTTESLPPTSFEGSCLPEKVWTRSSLQHQEKFPPTCCLQLIICRRPATISDRTSWTADRNAPASIGSGGWNTPTSSSPPQKVFRLLTEPERHLPPHQRHLWCSLCQDPLMVTCNCVVILGHENQPPSSCDLTGPLQLIGIITQNCEPVGHLDLVTVRIHNCRPTPLHSMEGLAWWHGWTHLRHGRGSETQPPEIGRFWMSSFPHLSPSQTVSATTPATPHARDSLNAESAASMSVSILSEALPGPAGQPKALPSRTLCFSSAARRPSTSGPSLSPNASRARSNLETLSLTATTLESGSWKSLNPDVFNLGPGADWSAFPLWRCGPLVVAVLCGNCCWRTGSLGCLHDPHVALVWELSPNVREAHLPRLMRMRTQKPTQYTRKQCSVRAKWLEPSWAKKQKNVVFEDWLIIQIHVFQRKWRLPFYNWWLHRQLHSRFKCFSVVVIRLQNQAKIFGD